MRVKIKKYSDKEIRQARKACHVAVDLQDLLGQAIAPGVSTHDLDELAVEYAKREGFRHAPLNYRGFPRSICTSVNNVLCHGVPNQDVVLKVGDIVKIDVTPLVDGYHGDMCVTYTVGEIREDIQKLVTAAYDATIMGVMAVEPYIPFHAVGALMESLALSRGFSIVREWGGHGVGEQFHEAPFIPSYGIGIENKGPMFRPGMVFTIEPILNQGSAAWIAQDSQIVTQDGLWSAQFEHTLAIDSQGQVHVLTIK